MRNEKELATAIRSAVRKRNLTKDQLARMLDVSSIMVDKLLCGEVEPSRHLEKQMVEILGIKEKKVLNLAERRRRRGPAKWESASVRKAA
jgi:ribosome-binding protein aMBF1 (putative translation factor)